MNHKKINTFFSELKSKPKSKLKFNVKLIGSIIVLCFFIILILSTNVSAIPQTFNIHGKLTDDSGNALSGNYDLEFKIYDVYSGGSALWEQNKTIASDSKGIYNIILSDIDLEFDEQYYLGIKVESDDEMTPRINLTSSPYSFTTSGLDEQINLTHNVSIDQNTLFIDTTNNWIGIGTTSPSHKLDVVGDVNAYGVLINGSSIASGVTGQINSTSWNRSGTDVYLSNIGDNVGIGLSDPGEKLSVAGNVMIGDADWADGTTTGDVAIQGNVGIGTTEPDKNMQINFADSDTSPATGHGLAGGVAGSGLLIYNTDSTANSYANLDFRSYNADGRIAYVTSGATNVADFHFITDNSGSPETKMVIKNDGNVGIGTTGPTAKLEVANGAIGVLAKFGGGGDERLSIYQAAENDWRFYVYDDTEVAYKNLGLGGTGQAVYIQSTGNVGIGTTAPKNTLNVEGTGNFTSNLTLSNQLNMFYNGTEFVIEY